MTGEVVRSCHAPTVNGAEMHSLVYTKAVVDTIVQSVLSVAGFIVSIAERIEKMVDRAVDQYHLCHMEEATAARACTELVIERSPPCAMGPLKIRSDSEFSEEPRRSDCLQRTSSICKRCENSDSNEPC